MVWVLIKQGVQPLLVAAAPCARIGPKAMRAHKHKGEDDAYNIMVKVRVRGYARVKEGEQRRFIRGWRAGRAAPAVASRVAGCKRAGAPCRGGVAVAAKGRRRHRTKTAPRAHATCTPRRAHTRAPTGEARRPWRRWRRAWRPCRCSWPRGCRRPIACG